MPRAFQAWDCRLTPPSLPFFIVERKLTQSAFTKRHDPTRSSYLLFMIGRAVDLRSAVEY